MRPWVAWVAVAALAIAAGGALWWLGRPPPLVAAPTISGAALYAVTFRDLQGAPQPLGQFQGRTLVLNFWATWCVPCRQEMPAFDRLARRWSGRGVAFVGVSQEEPDRVAQFQKQLGITYPLWTAGEDAAELARRLGNRVEGLPFTAIIAPDGRVTAAKVGPYTEAELEAILSSIAAKSG